jgi:hypothetical protein
MTRLWEFLVRFRTWVVNIVLAAMTLAPVVLNAPEILAVVPAEYQRYFLAGLFLLNIWLRPRPAVMAKDPEVAVKRKPDFTGGEV